MSRTKLYVGIPTTGTVTDSQAHTLREIEKRYADEIEFVWPRQCVRRIFHDFARNAIVEDFLQSDADILWFLDSDVTPPKHILDLITIHGDKWKAAGAPYPIFMCPEDKDKPQIVIAVFNGTDGKGMHPSKVPYEGQAFVDGLATGCLFLRREVFNDLKKPYFEFKYNPESRNIVEGEDLGFCFKLKALGIPFFVDYGMICKHYKNVCLLDVNNYAIDYANKNVLAYEKTIKTQVEELVKAYTKKKAPSIIMPEQTISTFKRF